jgi:hypothetical protein
MYPSEFTAWKSFKPTAPPTVEETCPDCVCENLDKNPPPITNTDLRRDLKKDDIITRTSTKTRFRILSAKETSSGVYEGQFYFMWEIYGNLQVLANYRDLRVNTDNEVLDGVKWKTVKTYGNVVDVDAIADAFGGGGQGGASDNNDETTDTVKVDFEIPDDPQITFNDSTGELTITDENGENPQTITLPQDSSGNTDFPVTVVDGSGDTYTVTKDGNGNVNIEKQEQQGDETESSEDKAFSLKDTEFLYVTVDGRQDTLMNNHTLNIPKQDSPIKLKIGFKKRELANYAGNYAISDRAYRKDLIVPTNFSDSIFLERTEWKISTSTVRGSEYEIPIDRMNRSIKLQINTANSISVIFHDAINDRDTLISSQRIEESKRKLEITINFVEQGLLFFKAENENYYQNYGFDDALISVLQQAGDYKKTTISGTDYYIPWLGVVPNEEVVLKTEYVSRDLSSDSIIVLRSSSDAVKFPENQNKQFVDWEVLFPQKLIKMKVEEEGTYTINAFSIKKGGTVEVLVGKLTVEAKNMTNTLKKVRIIRVRRSDEADYQPFDDEQKNNLITELNKYYKQAFLKFELDDGQHQDTLTIRKSLNEIIKSPENDCYKLLPSKEQKTNVHYLFICSRGGNSERTRGIGIMVNNMAVLFNPDGATPSHEIGHNLGLQHTFEKTNDNLDGACRVGKRQLSESSTNNIMDYVGTRDNRCIFFLYQINHLKNK